MSARSSPPVSPPSIPPFTHSQSSSSPPSHKALSDALPKVVSLPTMNAPYHTPVTPSVSDAESLRSLNRSLTARIASLERENGAVKHALYELSALLSAAQFHLRTLNGTHFALDTRKFKAFGDGMNPSAAPSHTLTTSSAGSAGISSGASGSNGAVSSGVGSSSSHVHRGHSSMSARHPLPFTRRCDLVGHSAAIYALAHSRDGALLASGGVDKNIRLWNVQTALTTYDTAIRNATTLSGHTSTVSDLSFINAASVVSGSFDRSVRVWDVVTGKSVNTFSSGGLVQCVTSDGLNTVTFGSTAKKAHSVDVRSGAVVASFVNDSSVSGVVVYSDRVLITSDSAGTIKQWDIRNGTQIDAMSNDSAHKPISHLHMSADDDHNDRLIAANSYDDTLRVYSADDSGDGAITLSVRNQLRGHRNTNWPIKSAFFSNSREHLYDAYALSSSSSSSSTMQSSSSGDESSDDNATSVSTESARGDTTSQSRPSRIIEVDKSDAADVRSSLLLASGSSDHCAYVWDISKTGQRLLQRVDGHRDRVYVCTFHPVNAYLMTAGRDATIKVWTFRDAN